MNPDGTRTCRGPCGLPKPPSDFYVDRRGRDGLYARCKACHVAATSDIERLKVWNGQHPERKAIRERRRKEAKRAGDLTRQEWLDIKARADGRCFYCREARALTMDHLVPLSAGGPHTASNVVAACWPCNKAKGRKVHPK